MAIYMFRCNKCSTVAEQRLPMNYVEADIPSCPTCGHEHSSKIPVCPAVVLDWHILGPDEGPMATAHTRSRGAVVPQYARR